MIFKNSYSRLYIGLLLIAFFISCAPSGGQSKLKVSVAAIAGNSNFTGALFFMGKNIETSESFVLEVKKDDSLEIELPNGLYNFYVTGWDNSEEGGSSYGSYEGNVYCDLKNNIKLEGEEVPLEMTATNLKCQNGVFNNDNGAVSVLNVQSCSGKIGIKKYLEGGNPFPANGLNCGGSGSLFPGGDTHYKIGIAEFGAGQTGVNTLSKCLEITSSTMYMPFGKVNELVIPVQVQTFSDSNCTEQTGTFNFRKGLNELATNNVGVAKASSGAIRLEQPLCNERHKNASFGSFTRYKDGEPATLICTQTQFSNIPNYTYGVYELGADIQDMSGHSTIPYFSGKLDGNGFSLKRLDKALFNAIKVEDPSYGVIVENLKIEESIINETYSLGLSTSIGFVSKKIESTSYNSNIILRNISIDNASQISTIYSTYNGLEVIHIGALVGAIDVSSTGSDLVTLDNIHSKASLENYNIEDLSSNSSVGGLIGYVNADKSVVNIGNSTVGTQVAGDWKNDSAEVKIKGHWNVGGLIGKAFGGQNSSSEFGINIYNSAAHAKMKAKQKVGGLIGNAKNRIIMNNIFGGNKFTPSADGSQVGGLIGDIPGNSNMYIRGAQTYLEIDSLKRVNEVGGVIGAATAQNNSLGFSLLLEKIKAELNVQVDGTYKGGVLGKYDNSDYLGGVSIDEYLCSYCLVEGLLVSKDISNPYNYAIGGFIGSAANAKIKFSIVNLQKLNAYERIGGAYGVSFESTIRESHISIGNQYAESGDPSIGGIVGDNNSSAESYDYFDQIVLNSTIQTNLSYCGSGLDSNKTCGVLYGDAQDIADSMVYTDIINYGKIIDPVENDLTTFCGGNNFSCSDSTVYTNAYNLNLNDACPGLSGSAITSSSGSCRLIFENMWKNYSSSNESYLAGNFLEPFKILEGSEWGVIAGDIFLVNMSFILADDIDLPSGYQRLGGPHDFRGELFSGGKTIYAPNSEESDPPFGDLEHAQLGRVGKPLKLSGFRINCSDSIPCGLISQIRESNIFVESIKSEIKNDGGGGAGGLIGISDGNSRLINSGFQGIVKASDGYVGGLIAKVEGSSFGSLEIKNSYIKSSEIYSANPSGTGPLVGGFVGYVNDGASGVISVENSYLEIYSESGKQGLLDGGVSKSASLTIAQANNITANFNYSFVDLKKANLSDNVNADISAGTSSVIATPYVLDKSSNNTSKVLGEVVISFTPRELISIDPRFSVSSLWVKSGDNLRLWWE